MELQPVYNTTYHHLVEEKCWIQCVDYDETWGYLDNMNIKNAFDKEEYDGMAYYLKIKTRLQLTKEVIQKRIEELSNTLKKGRSR